MNGDIAIGPLLAGLFGGLGLFLLGLDRLTEALRAIAGDRMRRTMRHLTGNRVTSLLTGAGVTAMVQSSSITTVLTIGFVSAGILSFTASLGVVLGANVGTTVTAQLIAFDIRTWALALVAVGSLGLLVAASQRWRTRADAALGIGLVFFAMQVMSDAMAPLRDSEFFVDLMAGLETPVLGLLAGAVFTALVQSSSATTALAIVLAGQGLLGEQAGIAIVIGANVGTCVTAGIAAIGRPTTGQRVAVAHIIVNLAGALVWVGFIDQLADLADLLPGSDTDPARALANAHTVFNVTNALVLIPFLGPFARFIERLVPERDGAPSLDHGLVAAPALALQAARVEVGRMASDVVAMSAAIPGAVFDGGTAQLDALAAADDPVDRRHAEIIGFLAHLGAGRLTSDESASLVELVAVANDLESIGDVIETNLVRLGRRRVADGVRLEPIVHQELLQVHGAVHRAIELAVAGLDDLDEHDHDAPERTIEMKASIARLVDDTTGPTMLDSSYHRMGDRAVELYVLEQDLGENLRRMYSSAKRIARTRVTATPVNPAAGTVDAPSRV
jgi:phosphate:Na+ symporter